MTVVGHVAALYRYPVKSMAAEDVADVEVSWHGPRCAITGRASPSRTGPTPP
jgi:uncharacterized protein YcbX